MMKWLHLPWHIEGNRVIHTFTGLDICRLQPPHGHVPVEQNRRLQLALDAIVKRKANPWILLEEALTAIEEAGYSLCPSTAAA
jgi:hypothetical protein